MKFSLGISNFLGEISSLSHLLFSSIYLHWLLRKAFLSLLAILWNSAFRCLYLSFSPLLFISFLFTAICKASQTAILLFCIHFPWEWSWSLSLVQYHEPPSIDHQALCLSDLMTTKDIPQPGTCCSDHSPWLVLGQCYIRMHVIGEGPGKTTALSSGLTRSFWLISCWCHPRIYVMGKGLDTVFTNLRHSFYLSSAAIRKSRQYST